MENIEQDPEEIPMDQVLAEIRQMLMNPATPSENKEVSEPTHPEPTLPSHPPVTASAPDSTMAPVSPVIPSTPDPVAEKPKAPDYFLLTPAMRCDLPPDSELSETVQKQTTRVLNKLQQQSNAELSPALVEWLNANLPAMIEKALQNHPKLGE